MLLAIDTLSKAYGDNLVLSQVSLTLDSGQKLGLVGANGVGKSTLLKIIVGEQPADSGTVRIPTGVAVGYLPQTLGAADTQTVEQLIIAAQGDLLRIEARMHVLERAMAGAGDRLPAILTEYGRLSETYERRGGYAMGHRLDAVLAGLQIDHLPRHRTVGTLSGGEKSRVGLAALLLASPELLLLDEPTNHLDFAALAWLESYLHDYRGGLIVVSHDRHFLNQTVTAILEIDEHSKEARHYSGSYDFYAEIKAQERVKREDEYWRQQEEIWELRRQIKTKARQVAHNRPARDGDKFLKYFKAEQVADAISRNVRSAEEKLRRIEADPIPRPPRLLQINPEFDPAVLASRLPLEANGLCKRYGDTVLLSNVSLAVTATSRIVILGPNGAGKSTLLRILAGQEAPDAGTVRCSPSVVLGYLDQEQESLDAGVTLYRAFRGDRIGEWEELKAELLGYGLFSYPDLEKRVGTLSVGQKRKLQIACLLSRHANLLLLDEPTNHVSLDVLEQFEAALSAFAGPVVAVSHDRRFIQRFAREIWELRDGALRRYLGGWEDYAQHASVRTEPTPNENGAT
jgi:macrolide transport system ATP-binding/permease protein